MPGLQSLLDEIDNDLRKGNAASSDDQIKRPSSSASLSGMCAKYVTTKHVCKCGQQLLLVNDAAIYNGDLASCNLCKVDIPKDKQFFHCASGKHKFGYDLCTECVFKKNESETNKQSDDDDGLLLFAYDESKQKKRRKSKRRKKRSQNKTKNDESESKNNETVKDLKRENKSLMKKNRKYAEKIKFLEDQIQLISKCKLENETTLKFVKKRVSDLVLTNEQIKHELSIQQKQNAKLKPESQWQLLCRLDANFKATKKTQSKKNKKIKENMDKIKKMEEIMGNLYQVFNNKLERQQIEMKKLNKKVAEFKRLSSSSSKVMEDNQREMDKKPDMNIYKGLVKSIENELSSLEKRPLDKNTVKEALDDLNDIQFSD